MPWKRFGEVGDRLIPRPDSLAQAAISAPTRQMGYAVQVPPKVTTATPQPDADQVIVRLDEAGHAFVNKTPIAVGDTIYFQWFKLSLLLDCGRSG
jgi:hypothetical protein